MNIRGTMAAIGLLVLVSTAAVAEEPMLAAEDLDQLVAAAVANNPELKSSQARWQLYVSKTTQAASLEDPMFMFKLQNMVAREPLAFDKDPQTGRVIGISQQLPFWGKRALREEVAQYEAESYKWLIAERALELTRMVKETYYQLYGVDKSLEVVGRNLQIIADFITLAETRYAVGQGVQQDIHKAGLEQSKMLDLQITLQQQRKRLEANLNYLLSRPPQTPVGPIPDFDLPKPALTIQQLQELAVANRPQVKSLISQANKGQAARRLAQRESYPDFNLAFEYMFRQQSNDDPGDNMFSLGVTINLPVQRQRRQALVAESAAETSMSLEELNALKNSIGYTITDVLAQLERRQKLVELYRGGIIPQAEQALESAIISYRVNKVDFLTLLDGRVNLFNYERELYESQAEYMMRLAQLEAVVGVALPLAENIERHRQ